MAKLSFDESDVLERVLSLKSGYVLDFINRTFSDFVSNAIGVDPYSGEYEKHGTSKAKILRGIIEIESDTTVSKLIFALLNREKKFPNLDAYPIVTDSDRNSAQGIALRLAGQPHTELAAISQIVPFDRSFEQLVHELSPIAAADALFCRIAVLPPPLLSERVLLMRTIEEFLATRVALIDTNALGTSAFGEMWQSELSDWEMMSEVTAWIYKNEDIRWIAGGVENCPSLSSQATELGMAREDRCRDFALLVELLHWDLQSAENGPDLDSLLLRPFEARLNRMLEQREQLSHWTSYQERSKRAKELGLSDFVGALETGTIIGPDLLQCFHASYYEGLLQDQLRTFPELARFDGALHERTIGLFRSMDLQHIKAAALAVARAHHRRIPPSGGIGPVGILRGEIAKRRAHMPIRQLMLRAAPVVQALKPVMMMSPLSVAQFLSPGHMMFDLLVMDEASQIQPVDALGAIARCRQIVVVGDERQLPPTQFFSKMTNDSSATDDDDETAGAQVGDVESVLGLCLARGLPHRPESDTASCHDSAPPLERTSYSRCRHPRTKPSTQRQPPPLSGKDRDARVCAPPSSCG